MKHTKQAILGKHFTDISTHGTPNIDSKLTKRNQNSHYRFIHDTISLCAKLGVSEFEIAGVHVKFGAESVSKAYSAEIPEVKSTEEPKLEMLDHGLLEDFRRAQGMLDDPLAYEHEIVREHLRQGVVNGDEEAFDRGTEFSL